MHFTRRPYGSGAPGEEVNLMFAPGKIVVPVQEYPISIRENFRRSAGRDHPVWAPNALTEFREVGIMGLGHKHDEQEERKPFSPTERTDFTDEFGCVWTFVPEAGGPMLKPNHPPRLDDITDWEKEIVWPEPEKIDYASVAPEATEKIVHVDIGQSCTERLVALLGGYTQAMMAMYEEPEAVADFLSAFADYFIRVFHCVNDAIHPDFVTFHDDWGTERDTFFSCQMMEQMVLEPTARIVRAIKDAGAVFELHSCGNIGRFFPYMIDMGVDFVQIQRRANDVPGLKKQYGNRIGFNVGVNDIDYDLPSPRGEDLVRCVRETLEQFGEGGGLYTMVISRDPECVWDACEEMYWQSREFYSK